MSDDGYHCPVPEKLKQNARRIYDAIFQTSGDVKFNPSAWCDIRRFIVPLLDQPSSVTGSPEGCGDLGYLYLAEAEPKNLHIKTYADVKNSVDDV